MIVNNGAVMRVKVINDQMVSGRWLKPGEVVMIPCNKAVKELEKADIAEVVKWRKRKVSEAPRVGPQENTALKPVTEKASKTVEVDMKKAVMPPVVKVGSNGKDKKKQQPQPQKKRR